MRELDDNGTPTDHRECKFECLNNLHSSFTWIRSQLPFFIRPKGNRAIDKGPK